MADYVSLVTSGTTVKWYVNGTQLGADGILPQTPNIGSEFYILSKQRPNNPDAYFNGLIDDISIWSHALSQEEIQMYMECPPVGDEEGLAGYWNFEAGPFAPVLDLSDNGNNGVAHGASWINETNNTQCLASLCEQIDITFLSLNTAVSPNTIEFEIDVQYDDEYGFGYGGFVLANDEGDIVAQETLETAANVYWIGQGINETRLLIANQELSFPFSGNLYLVEGFFSGNSNAECVYYFYPGCINETACNYNPDANQDDMSCYFIGDLCDDNDDTTGNDAYNDECECVGTPISTIDELEALSVLIYPNPASNNLTVDLVDLNGVNTTIKLYNSSSKIVFEKQSSSTLLIDVSSYAKGLYTLELSTPNKSLRSQVVIE